MNKYSEWISAVHIVDKDYTFKASDITTIYVAIRQGSVLMATIAPLGLVTSSPTPAKLANTETTHSVTVERHVFYVHPDITAATRGLTCLQYVHK